VAFLGALQVISTQAESDTPMLEELSARVAEVSRAGGGTIVTSSGVFELTTSQPIEAPATASESGGSNTTQRSAPGFPFSEPTPAAGEAGQAPAPGVAAAGTAPGDTLCPPAASGAPYCVYVVQEGDTLWDIAERLGLAGNEYFSGAELLAMSNDLNDAQNWVIIAGQELRVPNATGIVHTVVEAETVSVLAELYGVTTEDVILANPTLDPNNVITGAELLVPSPSLWPVFGPLVTEGDGTVTEADAATEETEEAAEGETDAAPEGETPATETPAGEETAPAEDATEAAGEESATPEGEAPKEAETTPEPVPEASPEAEAGRARNANPSVPEIRDQFAAGYIEAGGPPQHLERILNTVIPCESGYNLRAYNPAGPFYGLMQFLPRTWANTGGGDWADAWQQGANTARLLLEASNPRSQWPACWGG
jgi:LysM repeat protein